MCLLCIKDERLKLCPFHFTRLEIDKRHEGSTVSRSNEPLMQISFTGYLYGCSIDRCFCHVFLLFRGRLLSRKCVIIQFITSLDSRHNIVSTTGEK